jgi:hypothetical protein
MRFVAGSFWRAQRRRLPLRRGSQRWDLPAARPTPLLALQVALDEIVLTVMMSPKRMPHRVDYLRLAEEIPEARALYEARGWIDAPATFHPTPPPLTRRDLTRQPGWALGLWFERLTFESGYEPWPQEPGRDRWLAHEANRTAHAWVLRHKSANGPDGRPRPWLVCMHGFGTGSPFMDIAGFRARALHEKYGLNVVFPVLPLHGARKTGRVSGDGYMSYDLLDGVHAVAQTMWDVRRIVSWVRDQDAEQVGVYGISLGGYTAALLGTLDANFDCLIAGIPPSDFPALFRHHMPRRLTGRAQRYHLVGPEADAVHRVVSPLASPALVPFEHRYLYAGLGDRMSTPAQAYRLWEHWDRPQVAWYGGNHVGYLWSGDVHRFVRRSLVDAGLVDVHNSDGTSPETNETGRFGGSDVPSGVGS